MKPKKKIFKICGKILLGIVITVLIIILGVLLFLEFWPSVGNTPDKEMRESFAKKRSCSMADSSTMKTHIP